MQVLYTLNSNNNKSTFPLNHFARGGHLFQTGDPIITRPLNDVTIDGGKKVRRVRYTTHDARLDMPAVPGTTPENSELGNRAASANPEARYETEKAILEARRTYIGPPDDLIDEDSEQEAKQDTNKTEFNSIYMYGMPSTIGFTPYIRYNLSINNPIIQAYRDLRNTTINRLSRKVGLGTIIHPATITNLSENQKQFIRYSIQQKGGGRKGSWTTSDWKRNQGSYTGGKKSLLARSFGSKNSIEYTLGQWSWYTDSDGNIHVVDTYDWNRGQRSVGQGTYTAIRDFMGEYGSKDNDPKEQKMTYDINLGPISQWPVFDAEKYAEYYR